MTARFTSERAGLERREWLTTGAAFAGSTALYLSSGHPYLARGVVGDLLGLGVLGFILSVTKQRARHEALVCFLGIGAVAVTSPDWPLRLASPWWWAIIVGGVAAYLAARHRILSKAARLRERRR